MFCRLSSACGLVAALFFHQAACTSGSGEIHAADCCETPTSNGDKEPPEGETIKASEIDFDMLLRFEVPRESSASAELPLRVKAEVVKMVDGGPLRLRGYALVPRSNDAKQPCEYLKLDFGSMDIIAPLKKNKKIVLFPYDDACMVRKMVEPGDVLWIGIDAFSLEPDAEQKPRKLNIDVKVLRLISW